MCTQCIQWYKFLTIWILILVTFFHLLSLPFRPIIHQSTRIWFKWGNCLKFFLKLKINIMVITTFWIATKYLPICWYSKMDNFRDHWQIQCTLLVFVSSISSFTRPFFPSFFSVHSSFNSAIAALYSSSPISCSSPLYNLLRFAGGSPVAVAWLSVLTESWSLL